MKEEKPLHAGFASGSGEKPLSVGFATGSEDPDEAFLDGIPMARNRWLWVLIRETGATPAQIRRTSMCGFTEKRDRSWEVVFPAAGIKPAFKVKVSVDSLLWVEFVRWRESLGLHLPPAADDNLPLVTVSSHEIAPLATRAMQSSHRRLEKRWEKENADRALEEIDKARIPD